MLSFPCWQQQACLKSFFASETRDVKTLLYFSKTLTSIRTPERSVCEELLHVVDVWRLVGPWHWRTPLQEQPFRKAI